MFFKSREKEDRLKNELIQSLDDRFQTLRQEIGEGGRQMEELNKKVGQLQLSVQRHDMSIEDLLEEWEEKRSDEADVRSRFQEGERSENLLLKVFEAYQEQFWSLKRFTDTADTKLAEQLELMEKNLMHARQICGISMIGDCGAALNYDLHEVIEVLDTTDTRLDGMIAVVYSCGYLYKGKVKKKARVAVYRAI
ncbi:MAG: nucleotide exchange factor GrpE [Lachnospiraceae bacterium]|nr:nucleotide exchange factor GrpE [Lachnospiraceae bacterium]